MLTSLAPDPGALLRDGAFHQQHNEHKCHHDNGQHPEHIEVGERRCLLLAQVRERLQGQLLRGDRIAGLLQERPGCLEADQRGCLTAAAKRACCERRVAPLLLPSLITKRHICQRPII